MIILTLECPDCGFQYQDRGTRKQHKCPMCGHVETTEVYRDEAEEAAMRKDEAEWMRNNRNVLDKMGDEAKMATISCPHCGMLYNAEMLLPQTQCPICKEWEVHGEQPTRKGNGSIHCQTCVQIFGPLFCQTCENSVECISAVTMEQSRVVTKRSDKRQETYSEMCLRLDAEEAEMDEMMRCMRLRDERYSA